MILSLHFYELCSEKVVEHERLKRERKAAIIKLSIEYSIVTEFTSFIAVEEREKGEKAVNDDAPSVASLLGVYDVDRLDYIGWTEDERMRAAVLEKEKKALLHKETIKTCREVTHKSRQFFPLNLIAFFSSFFIFFALLCCCCCC